jgi:hypothetical protein
VLFDGDGLAEEDGGGDADEERDGDGDADVLGALLGAGDSPGEGALVGSTVPAGGVVRNSDSEGVR